MNLFGENEAIIPQRVKLRDYQAHCVRRIQEKWNEFQKLILVLPCGGGKTRVFAEVIRQAAPYRSLILVHRQELLDQAVEKIYEAVGFKPGVEKAESYASLDDPIVVASKDTMRGKRLERWPKNHFGRLINDECHRSVTGIWLKANQYFDQYAKVLGVTASPNRSDKKDMGVYYEEIAEQITLVDLIRQGWLSRLIIRTIPIKIDISAAGIGADGDIDSSKLGETLSPYLSEIAKQIKINAPNRKILCFLPLIATSKAFVKSCEALGITARHIDGEMDIKERNKILQDYREGRFQLLSNSMILVEGVDVWDVNCVCIIRPSKSLSMLTQMTGRGTRVPPGIDQYLTVEERLAFIAQSVKPDTLMLDFLWQHKRYGESLVRPAHLIAKTPEIAREMTAISEAVALGGDELQKLRAKVGRDVELCAEMDLMEVENLAIHQREKALLSQIKKASRKNSKVVSILELAQITGDAKVLDFEPSFPWHELQVTDAQKAALTNCGVDVSDVKNRGMASHLMDALQDRIKKGLASMGQIKYCRKLGHSNPESLTFEQASKYIESRKAQRRMG